MLTNVHFGQVRSGAADPVGVKAAESPQRQHGNRSFSDHMDDRARRDEAKATSEREGSNQSDRATERPKTADRPKQADQSRAETGETPAKGADKAPSASETQKADDQTAASDDNTNSQTNETDASPAQPDGGDTSAADSDLTANPGQTQETETKVLASDVPPVGAAQNTEVKTSSVAPALVSEGAVQARRSTGSAGAQIDVTKGDSVAAGDSDKTAQPTLAEAAPESMIDGVEAETATAIRTQAASGAQQAAAAGGQNAAQAAAAEKSVAATDLEPDQDLAVEQKPSDKAQAVSVPAAGVTVSQDSGRRAGDSRAPSANTMSVPQAAGGDDAAVAANELEEAPLTDKAGRDTSGKAASSGEVLAAVAGQSRAAAATEPGRRAEGRARESRDADAVVSGNATAATSKQSTTTPQVSAVQQAFNAQMLGGDAAKAGGQGAEAQLLNSDQSPDMPGLSQLLTEAAIQPGTVHRPETPRLVAVQLAQAFVAKGERNVDVALNPEELGRVKMRVSTSEAGITVVIQTERAETGDLMRRHINELADEFRKMGFENISFQFSGGGASGGQTSGEGESQSAGGTSRTGDSEELAAAEIAQTQIQHLRLGNAGVDMRV